MQQTNTRINLAFSCFAFGFAVRFARGARGAAGRPADFTYKRYILDRNGMRRVRPRRANPSLGTTQLL
jgi:hypothetical protein